MATAQDIFNGTAIQNFDSFTTKCENYLSVNKESVLHIKSYLKALYDVTKNSENADGIPGSDTLPELIVDNFDEEQIWQELELQNEARFDGLVRNVSRLVVQKDKLVADSDGDIDDEGLGDEDSASEDSASEDSASEDSAPEDGSDLEGSDNQQSRNINKTDAVNFDNETDESSDQGDSDSDVKAETKRESAKRTTPKDTKLRTPSIVDDKFFKLSEMEEFLKQQERGDRISDRGNLFEEAVDLFQDIPSSSESDESDNHGRLFYSGFFDAPREGMKVKNKIELNNASHERCDGSESEAEGDADESVRDVNNDTNGRSQSNGTVKKRVRLKLDDSDSNVDDSESDISESNNQIKSSYEIRQEKLKTKIQQLEEVALSEKPWQMKGEISAGCRPENALLEEAVEFDATSRPAPVMTEETTKRLEDVIKQRIKDRVWDDVVRKEKPIESVPEFKKKLVLDQEKSKLSLAQVYEQEYLKQTVNADPNAADKPEEVPKEHIEIKALVDSLFRKLDALSNFHFTPKQVKPEVKIVTNTPAISMEEVAPVATSDATLLAPEEVKAKPQGDVISTAERTDTDKKRERRKKKKHQSLVAREKEKREAIVAKLNPGLGNKYSKETALKLLDKVSKDKNVSVVSDSNSRGAGKSSSAFFTQLQEEVTSHIREKSQIKKRQKDNSTKLSVKRFKM